jgi:hypothetical protein
MGDPLDRAKNALKNPFDFKGHYKAAVKPIKDFMTPKMPGETQAEADLRARQAEDSAELDEEENRRIKRLLSASRGTRAYRGSPMFRARPSNSAGRVTTAAGSGTAGVGAIGMRAGGGRGGLARTTSRSLIP